MGFKDFRLLFIVYTGYTLEGTNTDPEVSKEVMCFPPNQRSALCYFFKFSPCTEILNRISMTFIVYVLVFTYL